MTFAASFETDVARLTGRGRDRREILERLLVVVVHALVVGGDMARYRRVGAELVGDFDRLKAKEAALSGRLGFRQFRELGLQRALVLLERRQILLLAALVEARPDLAQASANLQLALGGFQPAAIGEVERLPAHVQVHDAE